MPVPYTSDTILPRGPALPPPPVPSRRRGSIAVGCQELPGHRRRGCIAPGLLKHPQQQQQQQQQLPPRLLTARRCSLGRIFIEPEDEAVAIFSKYQSSFARRLKKDEALTMLTTEFKLTGAEAELMFLAFDKDANDVMSLWEFRQFYQTVGNRAHDTIELFKSLEVGDTGKVDIEKTFDRLQTVESGKGKLTDEEIEMFLKTTAGEAREIDFSKFLNMMCRIHLYKGPE